MVQIELYAKLIGEASGQLLVVDKGGQHFDVIAGHHFRPDSFIAVGSIQLLDSLQALR